MFIIVVLLSVYFISNIHTKYTSRPMIISLNATSIDIRRLPFPGKISQNFIILCYESITQKLSMLNYLLFF